MPSKPPTEPLRSTSTVSVLCVRECPGVGSPFRKPRGRVLKMEKPFFFSFTGSLAVTGLSAVIE